jgi:adenosine deaminase
MGESRVDKDTFYAFMKHIPKAEIHLHIEAVITLDSVKKLYRSRFGTDMSKTEQDTLFSYSDLNGFIKAFLKVQDLFQSVSDFDLVFADFADYLAGNNIVYCEAFFAPTAFLKKGFDYGEMISNFSRNIAAIKEKKNITIKLLVDVSRTFGCDNAMKNYMLLKQFPCSDVIGIGLGGAEQKGPSRNFEPVFDQAKKDGFHVVAHAGEDVGPESIWDAIRFLHAERIGHGITAVQDSRLMVYLKETRLPLEICITSNVFTRKFVKKPENHPIKEMFHKNLLVTVNTDDPVFFKTTLIDEYWIVYNKLNFTMEQIKTLICNGFTASFMSADLKKDFIASVEKVWNGTALPD